MPDSKHKLQVSRRTLLKVIAAAGGSLATSTMLPGKWVKPVVRMGVLPVHAQTSVITPTATQAATATQGATATARPTSTAVPSSTPAPTSTSTSTATPVPPQYHILSSMEDFVLDGSYVALYLAVTLNEPVPNIEMKAVYRFWIEVPDSQPVLGIVRETFATTADDGTANFDPIENYSDEGTIVGVTIVYSFLNPDDCDGTQCSLEKQIDFMFEEPV